METFNEFRKKSGFTDLNDVLSHYGIKGMRWGVRRSEAQLARARGGRISRKSKKPSVKPSEDAAKAAEALKKAKKGGAKALSNKELQQLNTRLNLEQQYNKLTNQKSKMQKGQDRVKAIIGMGKTLNDVTQFSKTPLAKQLVDQLKKGK